MKKYWPLIVTILTAAAGILSQPVQDFWAHHAAIASTIMSVWALIKWLLPSPVKS
jgi:hypothetical protein